MLLILIYQSILGYKSTTKTTRTMALKFNSALSLFIPSVLEHMATNHGIRHYLQRFGHIKAVDIVRSSKEGVYKAFVHFNEWYDDEFSRNYQRDIMSSNIRVELPIANGFFLLLPMRKNNQKTQSVETLPPMPQQLPALMYPIAVPQPSQMVRSDALRFGTTYDEFSALIDEIDEMTEVNNEIWKTHFPSLPKTQHPYANSSNSNTPRGVNNLPAWMTRGVNDEAELLKTHSEIIQECKGTSEDVTNGEARDVWWDEELAEDGLPKPPPISTEHRLKEEADKDNEWPPPLEWGEDADEAIVPGERKRILWSDEDSEEE